MIEEFKGALMSTFRLAVFDVDGTLTRVDSCWHFIHERLGTWAAGGKLNAELYFSGRISYEEWARRDVLLWKESRLERIMEIISEIPYVDGIKDVFEFLHMKNIKIVLLTAGIHLLAERISIEFGADDYIANELVVKNGKLSGEVKVKVSIDNKGEILDEILKKFNVKSEECLAVGDDETMIPVFQKVGLGIAFNPRSPKVEKYAKVTVKAKSLKEIIPHIEKHMKCKGNV